MIKKKVLIVEDSAPIRKALIFYLSSYYSVSEACNGQAAYEMVLVGDYDIIISDINMPEMDGVTLLMLLSKEGFLEKIKFFFSTSEDLVKKDIGEYEKYGLSGYIKKPIKKQSLLQQIGQG